MDKRSLISLNTTFNECTGLILNAKHDHQVKSSKKPSNLRLAPTSILMVYFKATFLRRPTFSMVSLHHRLPQ